MAWDDRSYSSRENYGSWGSGIFAALNGSIPLYEAFGIAVRMHVTLLMLIAGELLLDWKANFPLQDRCISMGALFGIILMHEYGHCMMARRVGGSSDRILLWPLGGLAYCETPHRPLPRFLTAAAGPMVNVVICVVAGLVVYVLTAIYPTEAGRVIVSLNPFDPMPPYGLSIVLRWIYWIFELSYMLLLFNLLPIYPLDGGQMTQTILWPRVGYVRSMHIATLTGLVGAVCVLLVGLFEGNLFLIMLAVCGFIYCYNMRNELKESGADEMYGEQLDFSESLHAHAPRPRKRMSRRAINRTRKLVAQEKAERERIDGILSKVSALGMQSLTWLERRALRKATDRQRKRDMELSELGMD